MYRLLDCEEDLDGNDRIPALEALKNMVRTQLNVCLTSQIDVIRKVYYFQKNPKYFD